MAYRVINEAEPTKALLDRVTARLLKERGPNFTIREVCAAAGVSIGTFYTYYESKDALIAARLSHTDSFLMEAVAGDGMLSPAKRILNVTRAYFAYLAGRGVTSSREVLRCMMAGHLSLAEIREGFLYRYILEQAKHGLRRGDFRDGLNAEGIAQLVSACCKGATQDWCQCPESIEIVPYGMALVELQLRILAG